MMTWDVKWHAMSYQQNTVHILHDPFRTVEELKSNGLIYVHTLNFRLD